MGKSYDTTENQFQNAEKQTAFNHCMKEPIGNQQKW